LCISVDGPEKKEIEIKKSIDGLTRDGKKLTREMMTTATNAIKLTFLCGISRRKEKVGGRSGSQENAGGLEWQPDGNR
jgi:hypothetical protein